MKYDPGLLLYPALERRDLTTGLAKLLEGRLFEVDDEGKLYEVVRVVERDPGPGEMTLADVRSQGLDAEVGDELLPQRRVRELLEGCAYSPALTQEELHLVADLPLLCWPGQKLVDATQQRPADVRLMQALAGEGLQVVPDDETADHHIVEFRLSHRKGALSKCTFCSRDALPDDLLAALERAMATLEGSNVEPRTFRRTWRLTVRIDAAYMPWYFLPSKLPEAYRTEPMLVRDLLVLRNDIDAFQRYLAEVFGVEHEVHIIGGIPATDEGTQTVDFGFFPHRADRDKLDRARRAEVGIIEPDFHRDIDEPDRVPRHPLNFLRAVMAWERCSDWTLPPAP